MKSLKTNRKRMKKFIDFLRIGEMTILRALAEISKNYIDKWRLSTYLIVVKRQM